MKEAVTHQSLKSPLKGLSSTVLVLVCVKATFKSTLGKNTDLDSDTTEQRAYLAWLLSSAA